MQHILITGSSRGVGLALVHEWLARDNTHIYATCRNPQTAHELTALAEKNPERVSVIALDVTDSASIEAAAKSVSQLTTQLDILVNNAGIYPKDPESQQFGSLTAERVLDVLTTNAVAPLLVTQAFMPLLQKGTNPRLVMISSQVGSITNTRVSYGVSYRMSKTALNMATKILANEYGASGMIVITTHPGHVATDMGGQGAPVSPQESASGLVALTERLTPDDNGHFFNYDGRELPW